MQNQHNQYNQQNQPTPQLNPSELYDKRRSKDNGRLKAYNKILEQIYNRIRTISKLPNSQCYLLYTVPPFILGLPKLDLEDCIVYLIYQLRQSTYEVRYTPPNMVYISWLHHEKSYLVEQSPIMQAMLESSERSELERKEKEASRILSSKKSRKIVKNPIGMFQQPQNQMNQRNQRNQKKMDPYNIKSHNLVDPTAGPPPPSAGDYVPPASFLQNMINPPSQMAQPKSVPEYFR